MAASAASPPMWTSHLGHKFPRDLIDRLDGEHHRLLQKLRAEPANAHCAECGEGGTAWASVNLGVFLCLRCADVHRALGTHVSKVKGCTGTYLWGPDEIARMQDIGNAVAEGQYGGACKDARPGLMATKEERVELCRKKYEQRLWAPPALRGTPPAVVCRGVEPFAVAAPPAARKPNAAVGRPAPACGRPGTGGAAARGKRPTPLQEAGVADYEELFKDFDVSSNVKPVDLLHKSQWWAGGKLRASGTPASSTVASEADLDVFLERCLSEPELGVSGPPASPAMVVAAAETPAKAKEVQAGCAKVWEDFGAW